MSCESCHCKRIRVLLYSLSGLFRAQVTWSCSRAHAAANLLFAFWAPLFYLVSPEVRDSKFMEHALPGAYYGPSRDTESERYHLV